MDRSRKTDWKKPSSSQPDLARERREGERKLYTILFSYSLQLGAYIPHIARERAGIEAIIIMVVHPWGQHFFVCVDWGWPPKKEKGKKLFKHFGRRIKERKIKYFGTQCNHIDGSLLSSIRVRPCVPIDRSIDLWYNLPLLASKLLILYTVSIVFAYYRTASTM